MDDTQKLLVKMIKEQPSCINDRKQLRAVLLDYLPQNKLQQNLILNAYDEDVVKRLTSSADVALHALQMVKILSDSYGLTKDAATWSVVTWCQMMRLGEVANMIESTIGVTQSPSTSSSNFSPSLNKVTVGLGIYKAGVDIPSGELKISQNEKSRLGIFYGISKNPNRINDNKKFRDQTYITIEPGQYLKLFSFESEGYTMTITKE